jgi:hypothetical protein
VVAPEQAVRSKQTPNAGDASVTRLRMSPHGRCGFVSFTLLSNNITPLLERGAVRE